MWNCALRHCNVLYINSLVFCFEHIRTNFCISAYSCRRERCFKLEVSSLLFSLHAVQVCQVVLYFLVLCICTCTCGTAEVYGREETKYKSSVRQTDSDTQQTEDKGSKAKVLQNRDRTVNIFLSLHMCHVRVIVIALQLIQ